MSSLDTNSPARVAYVFPGQGSQVAGMGYEVYRSSREACRVFEEADDALGFPISRLCFEGPAEELRETVNSQPAILTVSIACLAAAAINGAVRPVYMAGHSLGEYTALVAAGVLDFADAIRLVRERGRLMQEAGVARPGTMAAIIGLGDEAVEDVCREAGAQIANLNCAGQIVVSGTREAVARTMDLAQSRGAAGVVPLEVSGAFHSELMRPAAEGMARAVSQLEFRTPEVPIVANCSARPMTTSSEVREELLLQLCSCVQWQPSVEYMVEDGVTTFIEIGPGIVLSKLIKRISRSVRVLNMGDTGSIQAVREAVAAP